MIRSLRASLAVILSIQLSLPAFAQMQSGASGSSAGAAAGASGVAGAAAGAGAAALPLSQAPGLALNAPLAQPTMVVGFLRADLQGLSRRDAAGAAKHLTNMLAVTGPSAPGEDSLAAMNQARALVRLAVANPKDVLSPGGLIALESAFGAELAGRLKELSERIHAAAARDPEVRAALKTLRRPRAVDQAVWGKVLMNALIASGALKAVFVDNHPQPVAAGAATPAAPKVAVGLSPYTGPIVEAEAAPLAPAAAIASPAGDDGAASKAPATVASPSRVSRLFARLKQAMVGLFIATSLMTAAPGITHSAQPALPSLPALTLTARIPGSQAASEGYVQVRDVNDLIARYDKDVRLYVVGNIQGMGQAEYRALARFLSDKHWVVVLVDDASGSRFIDVDGNTRYDADAFEYGTGQGLPRNAGFQALVNSQTGEPDGAVLTIIMQQRVLLLHTSKAQDARGMNGETQFKGNLDRWAVDNMKRGGNVRGAVEETVANIDELLAQKIADEATTAKQAVAEAQRQVALLESTIASFNKSHPRMAGSLGRHDLSAMRAEIAEAQSALARKDYGAAATAVAPVTSKAAQGIRAMEDFDRSYDSAKEGLAAAKRDIAQLSLGAADFRESFPKVTGDVARPDVKGMSEALSSAEKALASDPASAARAAQSVRSQVASAQEAIAQYPSGKQMIETAEARLAELQGRQRASAAAVELASAKTTLGEAREQWETGGAQWSARLEQAKQQLSSAETLVAQADSAAATERVLFWLFSLVAALGTALTGLFLRRRVRPVQAKTRELLDDWTAALDRKLEVAIDELDGRMSRYIGPATGPAAGRYAGETARLAVQTREDIGSMHIFWGAANKVLGQAKALEKPSNPFKRIFNYFFPGNHRKALRRLQDEPVTFKPEDGLEEALGARKKDWKDDLLGDLKDYKPFSMSFQELMAEFNKRAARSASALELVEKSILTAGPVLQGVEDKIAAAEAKKKAVDAAGAQDGLFLIPSAFSAVLPAAKAEAAKAREVVKTDPVGGLKGSGAQASRLTEDAEALINAVTAARQGTLATVGKAAGALKAAGISVSWIETELSRTSGRAEALAVKAAAEPAGDKIQALEQELAAFAEKAARAASLAREWTEAKALKIEKANVAIEAARMELGAKLDLEADKVMREADADPSDFIAGAASQAGLAQKALGAGRLEEARAALDELSRLSAEAKGIVDASKSSVDSHEKTVLARRAETSRIEGQVSEHEAILAAISKKYAKSALSLTAGDPSHPNGNGTVEDNVGETTSHIADSKAKVEKAVKVFRDGRVLQAASLLAQVAAHQESAVHRLSEIKEKQARLERTEAADAKTLGALDERVKTYEKEVAGDRRTMTPTLKAYQEAKGALEAARRAVQATKGDPFKAEALLATVTAAMDQMWVQARNDRDAHAEADRSLKAAGQAIDAAKAEAGRASGDGLEDSPEIRAAYGEIESLARRLSSAQNKFGAANGDWNEVDREADAIANAAGQAAATLKREMAEAQAASSEISRAASKVREASNWSGSYGVYISGSPGSGSLDSARASMRNGDYEGAKRHAAAAYRAADSAIDEAEAEVSRRRREEEERRRREEEERRRREREEEERRNRSSGGGYGGGGSGSGSGGGSWGGSSSGSGRSGW